MLLSYSSHLKLNTHACVIMMLNEDEGISAYNYNKIPKWVSRITRNGKTYHLGYYRNKFDAKMEYNLAFIRDIIYGNPLGNIKALKER